MGVLSKIVELQNPVTQSKSGLSLLTPRFWTKISHLRGRLTHLTNLGLFPSKITTSHYQELHDQLDRIEQNTASFEMADRKGQAKEVHGLELVSIHSCDIWPRDGSSGVDKTS